MESLRRYNFTKAFIGVTGITIAQGFTTPDPEAADALLLRGVQPPFDLHVRLRHPELLLNDHRAAVDLGEAALSGQGGKY